MIARILLALLLLAPAASAGTADAPESSDPAGDAGPNGMAAPGHEDLDLLSIWFENENLDAVDLVIKVAGPMKQRPLAYDWGVQFSAKGATYYTGNWVWNAVQSGTYLCRDGADCVEGVQGSRDGDLARVTLPKAALDNATVGDTLLIERAWAISCAGFFLVNIGFGQCVNMDEAPAGTPFVLAKGKVPLALNGTAEGTNTTLGATGGAQDHGQHPANEPMPINDTPAASALLVLAAAGLAVLAARRR